MVAPPRPLPRRQARHALVAWPRGRRLPRSRHRPVVLCRQHTACRADQPLVREAGRLSCPHQPFLVSPQQHNLLHTFCPPPAPWLLFSPPCTSANGGVKVNVGFHEDRREIGRIRFEVYKVLSTAGWSLSHNDRGRDRVFSTALTHQPFKMLHKLLLHLLAQQRA